MTLKRLLSSKQLFLAAWLLAVSAPAHTAEPSLVSAAEPSLVAKADPVGNWQVAKIKTDDETDGRFCSMKNAYPDGSFLVFARDAGNANSIAFEFPAHHLTVGGTYPMTLTVDRFYRETQALAATPRVLVAQLGADEALYNLLAQKDALRMSVAGKEYVFGLKGTAKAFRALDDCAGVRRAPTFAGLPPVFSNVAEGFDPPIGAAPVIRQDLKSFVQVRRPVPQNPVTTAAADPAQMTSKDAEIERLRAENKALQLEKEAAAERLRAEAMHKVELEKALEEQNRREQLQFEEKARQMEAQLREKEAALETERLRQQEALRQAEETAKRMQEEKKRLAQETKRLIEADAKRITTDIPVKAAPPKSLRAAIAEAGIVAGNAIRVDGRALVWQRDDLFGTAEDLPSHENESLSAAAERYMSEASTRCVGDYAGNLGRENVVAGGRSVLEAEIACINGTNDSAAVLLFVREQGKTSVIINETPADAVAKALEARGKLTASFSR